MKKLDGMVISELLTALVICGVIVVASISVFKAFDLTRTPYIYSVMKNLPVINTAIEDDCYKEGRCSQKRQLPNSRVEYCLRLVNNFTTTQDVDCNPRQVTEEDQGEDDTVQVESSNGTNPRNNKADGSGVNFYYNFRLTNGVAFFGITNTDDNTNRSDTWHEISKLSNGNYPNKYIDILIDINGDNGTNTFGDDVFPIRIFQNGDVVPGVANLSQRSEYVPQHYYNNEELFGYKVVLNTYKDNSLKSYDVDTRTSMEKTNNSPIITRMSLRQAYFSIYNNTKARDVMEQYYRDKQSGGWNLEADDTTRSQVKICECAEKAANDSCRNNFTALSDVETAHCTVELAKPRGAGFIRLLGL